MEKDILLMVETDKISPCPYQCRYRYDIKNMETLIQSVRTNGILQPLTATRDGDGFQLISGHRRLFAAKMLKLERVPVVVMEKSREEIAVLCAVENMHREDLNCFEQAMAIRLLIDQLGLTQQQAGEKLAMTQSAVANKLRLLQMSKENADLVIKEKLTERHARAVLRLEESKQKKALEHIIKHNLNVAATDRYIDGLLEGKKGRRITIKIRDVRIFTNTINNALKIMKNAGFAPQFEQNITETRAEYRIVIPFDKSQSVSREVQAAQNR
ncbi:MAG: ParB/RepB/Spo0J family partition protein [Oscillospiraceae bacterium]|nr:ParB/RepB/Spo0J family partition protein [Oscillospiraceae bacterium]